MKIAVTAANGNLGAAIVKELKTQIGAENVIAIARSPKKAEFLGVEVRKGDYDSYTDFESALKGVDKILVVSGMDTPKKRIQQHRNIIKAAEANSLNKIVYTSIVGNTTNTAFDPIINSNRQTERDIEASKLNWAIGRNGLYIEPDLEYIEQYKTKGCIWNSAGDGKCAYTSREELANAYVQMLLNDSIKYNVYNLAATPITQQELANEINKTYSTKLTYKQLSSEEYLEERKAELGNFIGTVVSGIYDGINNGSFNVASDYEKVMNRKHKLVSELIKDFKNK